MKKIIFSGFLVVLGVAGCKKDDPAFKVLPGRLMSEAQVLSRATAVLHPGPDQSQFHITFKDGVWEVSCLSNYVQHVVTVRDADGKLERVK